jgi:clan AA aspartic protease (TIGR02281 family)
MRASAFLLGIAVLALPGCAVFEAAGEAVGVVGKVGWSAARVVGKVTYAGTSMAGQTANGANKSLMRPSTSKRDTGLTVVGNRTSVPLEFDGKSYFVRVKFNDNVSARLVLDTGASAVQISKAMAKKLKLSRRKSQAIPVTLAGGVMVAGRMVTVDSIRLGGVMAKNVKVIILDYEQNQATDGLLGMSFLENFIFQIDTRKSLLILEKR